MPPLGAITNFQLYLGARQAVFLDLPVWEARAEAGAIEREEMSQWDHLVERSGDESTIRPYQTRHLVAIEHDRAGEDVMGEPAAALKGCDELALENRAWLLYSCLRFRRC
ncbi:hypothetical protein SAMN06265221_103165 [Paracoccus laeviglucosivorans]|uniref:Uncharacterized protein n=1 Tax=Paracoccus laeviglucosivorans TaxID=1197861 RepID=A0A521BVK0_9RHOB|nr:hypothetical protein SAMN06265221_103165 [Paracoccus laeviglucosivorans]